MDMDLEIYAISIRNTDQNNKEYNILLYNGSNYGGNYLNDIFNYIKTALLPFVIYTHWRYEYTYRDKDGRRGGNLIFYLNNRQITWLHEILLGSGYFLIDPMHEDDIACSLNDICTSLNNE